MNSATAKTSAIDHFAMISTIVNVRRRPASSRRKRAHETSDILANGTMTLNSRISVAAV
jgi:hypothetical protein